MFAPSQYSGMLTAGQVADAMADGWSRQAPGDVVMCAPLSAGEAGFASVVEAAVGGVSVGVTVADPLGRDVPATVLLAEVGGVRTGFVEAAQAAGLHLLDAADRDPCVTSTFGVGQMIEVAVAEGASRVVVACGGTGTNDAGAGMLAALGAGQGPALCSGGGALGQISPDDVAGLEAVRDRLIGVELVVAAEGSLPLLGFSGASATTAPEKGASVEQTQELERSLGHFVDVVERVLPSGLDLLTGLPRRVTRVPGAGAGGGLGYGLVVLGARVEDAVSHVMGLWSMRELLGEHDLVVTGERCFDGRSVHAGVVVSVAAAAAEFALPTMVLAGQVEVGRRESMSAGIAAVYGIVDRGGDMASVMADPASAIADRAQRLARTWSR
nr:glycerate kinase [Dermatophilus congolensis]